MTSDTSSHPEIQVVDPAGPHLDQDLAGPGVRVSDLGPGEGVEAPMLFHAKGVHYFPWNFAARFSR